MSDEPASLDLLSSHDPRRVIGLFLAKLLAYVLRLQTSGQTNVPEFIAYMVGSAERLVNYCIRMQAAAQLRSAGFTDAARAMRDPDGLVSSCSRLPSERIERVQDCLVCSREPEVHIELAQGCNLMSVAEALDRLQTTIKNFERAGDMANLIARVIVCAFAYIFPEVREPAQHASPEVRASNPSSGFDGAVINPWPPPVRGQIEFSVAA